MGQPKEWELAFRRSIWEDWCQIMPALPDYAPVSALDIGAGMGTIDILLDVHYRAYAPGHPSSFVLVDGAYDPPEPVKSWKTHSNREAALFQLGANGVANAMYLEPADLARPTHLGKFDLILSMGSWCFHYEPNTYLDQVLPLAHADTVFILDLRKDRPHWLEQLSGRLEQVRVLADLPKAYRTQLRLA